jgi:membrane-bound lytic murein transglycosylase F
MHLIKAIPFCTLFLALLVGSCASGVSEQKAYPVSIEQEVERDWEQIRKDGILRAATIYSGTTYFLYKGQPMGFDYDLLIRLAEYFDLELQIAIARDMDELIKMVNRGEVDLIAAGMTMTEERSEKVAFTEELYLTHQVLIQKMPDNWYQLSYKNARSELIGDAVELIGDTVTVHSTTAYYPRLLNLQEEIGGSFFIDTINGNMPTEKLIEMVANGEIKMTVADENIANMNAAFYPILDVSVDLSFSQRVGWAVRNNSPVLLDSINEWVHQFKDKVEYHVLYDKYYSNKRSYKQRVGSEFFSTKTGKISQYDDLIKQFAADLGWDWRLLSSLIDQESNFNPSATAWSGASGLMQLMPATAQELGLVDMNDPVQNLAAGTQYLKQMWDYWPEIADSVQRLKFTMASYNCGYGHVLDAQRLTEKYGADPLVWDENVEEYMLKLTYSEYYYDEVVKYGYVRGIEPYSYVKEVFGRYEHYQQLIPFVADTTASMSSSIP